MGYTYDGLVTFVITGSFNNDIVHTEQNVKKSHKIVLNI